MISTDYIKPQQTYWQIPGEQSHDLNAGLIVGIHDVDQCVVNILSTPKGTDILRPLFGCDLYNYIDTPEDIFKPNAIREVIISLKLWEKRIVIDSVSFSGHAPHLTLIVTWHLVEDVAKTIQKSQVLIHA